MRRILGWLALLATIGSLALFLIELLRAYNQPWRNDDALPFLASVSAALGLVTFFLLRRRTDHTDLEPDWASSGAQPLDRVVGGGFDGATATRNFSNFASVRPATLRGRAGQTRAYPSRRGWRSDEITSFHLDYDRSSNDYGDVIVKLNLRYFKDFVLDDGDDLEIKLRWKRGWLWARHNHFALIKKISNFTSGQSFDPDRVGEHAGLVEVQH